MVSSDHRSDHPPPPSHPSPRPTILVVTRRALRKNKHVNYVGEYHISLLLHHGAVPVLLPRLPPTSSLLPHYHPYDGLLLVEGEDIGPSHNPNHPALSTATRSAVLAAHPADAHPDLEKDRIEFNLLQHAFENAIPVLAICRGSQLVNVAAGGSLIPDIDLVMSPSLPHIDYHNYDDHRHPIHIIPNTPLSDWFDAAHTLSVNSYHHQGINHLAARFKPMAHAPDGLIEAFYDPAMYDPHAGKFLVGLQFHPERMQCAHAALRDQPPVYDYPGCPRPYQHFVAAAAAYRKKRLAALMALSPRAAVPTPRYDHDHIHESSKLSSVGNGLSNYSKDDIQRIIRSGGTVHGSTLVLKMLQKENSCTNHTTNLICGHNDTSLDGCNPAQTRNQWRRFRRGIEQAGRALQGFTDRQRIDEAHAMLLQLTEICESIAGEDSVRSEQQMQKTLISRV